ncbi:hypothetical protein CRUP_016208 [Coryphaenoides rupestris]|nr:hypothetical protein CRUP_016208 [Coryphaenoides rupestris]
MSSLPAKVMRDGLLEKAQQRCGRRNAACSPRTACACTRGRRNGNGNGNSNGNGGGNGNGQGPPLRAAWPPVDCVEYKRGLVYFTVVMATGKEIDFRCAQDGTAWNAEIALALVRYKNLQAVQTGKNRHLSSSSSSHIGEEEEAL